MSLNDTVNDAGLSAMDTLPKERVLTPSKTQRYSMARTFANRKKKVLQENLIAFKQRVKPRPFRCVLRHQET
jgi:hypothetical protein